MKKPLIKVCGITRADDVSACCSAGVDLVGFVTEYPIDVLWNLTEEEAGKLMAQVRRPAKRCLVTGGKVDRIVALTKSLRPDYLQLHYKETLEDTKAVIEALKDEKVGVVKTLPVSRKERIAQFGTEDIETCVGLLNEVDICAIVVDFQSGDRANKRSKEAYPSFYAKVKAASTHPVVLSGDISPLNIRRIMETSDPDIISILSGIEVTPGFKSTMRLQEIIKAAWHLDEADNKYANYGVEGGEGEVLPENPEDLKPLGGSSKHSANRSAHRKSGAGNGSGADTNQGGTHDGEKSEGSAKNSRNRRRRNSGGRGSQSAKPRSEGQSTNARSAKSQNGSPSAHGANAANSGAGSSQNGDVPAKRRRRRHRSHVHKSPEGEA